MFYFKILIFLVIYYPNKVVMLNAVKHGGRAPTHDPSTSSG